jgi:hypothetical protein
MYSSGNRWYDQAFSEMVCETLDFDPKAPWSCVMGGAQQIALKMQEKINTEKPSRITFDTVVKQIGYIDHQTPLDECLEVGFQTASGETKEQYHGGE